jgi:hypothetical protein
LEQRLVIMLVGTKIWKDVNWDGQGRRGVINMDLDSICCYMYLGIVSVGGLMCAAHSWDDWGRKTYANQEVLGELIFWM